MREYETADRAHTINFMAPGSLHHERRRGERMNRRWRYVELMPLIARRFRGPAGSGNGGYTCGILAGEIEGIATTMLLKPPPLDTELAWERDGETVKLVSPDGDVVGTGRPGEFKHEPLAPVSLDEARDAMERFLGDAPHPFPECFTCGTGREVGDGLLLRPGPASEGVAASVWRPHENFASRGVAGVPVTWAAIDCPGVWSAAYEDRPMVLGRMTGEVLAPPRVDREYISVGRVLREDGRKLDAATALYSPDGDLLARAEQTWIEIDLKSFAN